MSETKEPCEVEQIERKNTTEMNEVENTVRKEEQGTLLEPCRLKDITKRVAMAKKYMQALRLKQDVLGTIKINYDNTPVGNGRP